MEETNEFVVSKQGILREYNGHDVDIVLPNSVKKINYQFFWGKDVKSIVFSDKMTEINELWFGPDLETVIIPEGIRVIGDRAFYNCRGLRTVNLPNSLIEIGTQAFQGCDKLERIELPDDLKKIGSNAFAWCQNLKEAILPDSLDFIEGNAFEVCSALKLNRYDNAYYLGSKSNPYMMLVSSIEIDNPYNAASKIVSCKIHPETKFIAEKAFEFCRQLEEIIIPNGVKAIGNYAFSECSNLNMVSIPESVKYMGHKLFEGCSSLTILDADNGEYLDFKALSTSLKYAAIRGFLQRCDYDGINKEKDQQYIEYIRRRRKSILLLLFDFPPIYKYLSNNNMLTLDDINRGIENVSNVEIKALLLNLKNKLQNPNSKEAKAVAKKYRKKTSQEDDTWSLD